MKSKYLQSIHRSGEVAKRRNGEEKNIAKSPNRQIAKSFLAFFVSSWVSFSLAADDGWQTIPVPGAWEEVGEAGLKETDGFAWYRCWVKVPAEWKGNRLLLVVQKVDDVDEGFFNGREIGANGSPPPLFQPPASGLRRPFVIDPDAVRYGDYNLVTLRVYDSAGPGGITQGPVRLVMGDKAIDLSGKWQFRVGDNPNFAHWPAPPGTPEAIAAVEKYIKAVGQFPAGHRGISTLDETERKAMVKSAVDRFGAAPSYVNARSDDKGDPLPPDKGLAALKVPEDLAVDLVAHEPLVAQPIHVSFDERGRMWVTQYIQYPVPAGLTVVSYDEHLRAIFDKVPPPPPHHDKGRDKITIHEDTAGDGTFDKVKTFVEGLNITTAVARGRGGVWVLNPPYLLFYPDANNDDVPDSDPVVHLSGFGLEDTHSVANSLTWGPDGWLYGGQGSTTTARVKVHLTKDHPVVPFLGQAIWRYHPSRHVFEIFAEGGHNTFGVDFDDVGRVYSGTNGSARGHYFAQGAYHQKGFGKHGPLTNPYAFGYFDAFPHTGDQTRLTHQFIIDGGGTLPERYRGKMIAVNSLANWVVSTRLEPWGNSFKTVDELKVIETADKWFRPVHVASGPDGAAYISDWYDARITHLDPRDNWDHDRGRIYRLRNKNQNPGYAVDLNRRSTGELAGLLGHTNRWTRDTALRLIGDRRDKSIVPALLQMVEKEPRPGSLYALWALYQLGAFEDELAMKLLDHKDEFVRAWAVRLVTDEKREPPVALVDRMAQLACKEPSAFVRSQLAASSKRMPGEHGLRIVRQLVTRDEDGGDPYIPLQLWWAVEDKAVSQRQAVALLFSDTEAWALPLVKNNLMPKLARRYAADPTEETQQSLAMLIRQAPDAGSRQKILEGMSQAFEGRRIQSLSPALAEALRGSSGDPATMPAGQLALLVRTGDAAALDGVLRRVTDETESFKGQRIELITLLGQVGDDRAKPVLLEIAASSRWHSVRRAALGALGRFNDDTLGEKVVAIYTKLPTDQDVRPTALGVLTSRGAWVSAMLRGIESGAIAKADLPAERVEQLRRADDAKLLAAVEKIFGKVARPTSGEKQAEIERLAKVMAAGTGDAAQGKIFFTALCLRCHRFNSEGASIGPDLTVAKRDDVKELLLSIVDPSAGIHEDFAAYIVTLTDGRQLVGFITDRQADHITLKDIAGTLTNVPHSQIKDEKALPNSIMPENLLAALPEQQARDLMAYLMKK